MIVEFSGVHYHEICLRRMIEKNYNDLIDFLEAIPCGECGGERYCDYGFGEEVRTMACEMCNADDEPDEERDDGF